MPIDEKTLGTQTPMTEDGRAYPRYLRAFEQYDGQMLAKVRDLDKPTLNALAVGAPDPRVRSAVSPWIASAEWRALIERVDTADPMGKRRYRLTGLGEETLAKLS